MVSYSDSDTIDLFSYKLSLTYCGVGYIMKQGQIPFL